MKIKMWPQIVFLTFLMVMPIFGKAIDRHEEVFFYGVPLLLVLIYFLVIKTRRVYLSKISVYFQLVLLFLWVLATVLSVDIGFSYSRLFNFFVVWLVFDMANFYLSDLKLLYKFLIGFSCIYSLVLIGITLHWLAFPVAPSGDNFILQVWGHSYLADLLIFPIIILFSKINVKNYKTNLPILIFLLGSLFLTESRSGIVAAIIGLIFIKINSRLVTRLKLAVIFLLFITLGYFFYQSRPAANNSNKSFDGSRMEYWREATIGFTKSPLIGNGPFTFGVVNKLYRNSIATGSVYVHNSLLQYLVENGLIFTVIFYGLIIIGLIYRYKTDNLLFCLGLAALVHSFLDPTWSSPGILVLSLIFFLYRHPLFFSFDKKDQKSSDIFLIFIIVAIFLYSVSNYLSNYFYETKDYELSLKFNPANFNTLLANSYYYQDEIAKYHKNNPLAYYTLASETPLPQGEKFYLKLFKLDPKSYASELYYKILNYYINREDFEKAGQIVETIDKNINTDDWPTNQTMPLAKTIYQLAITEWRNNRHDAAVKHLQVALKFSKGWGTFYIELANVYWHNGQRDKAYSVLMDDCGKNKYSVQACADYKKNNENNFLMPGSEQIKSSIRDIFVGNN